MEGEIDSISAAESQPTLKRDSSSGGNENWKVCVWKWHPEDSNGFTETVTVILLTLCAYRGIDKSTHGWTLHRQTHGREKCRASVSISPRRSPPTSPQVQVSTDQWDEPNPSLSLVQSFGAPPTLSEELEFTVSFSFLTTLCGLQ